MAILARLGPCLAYNDLLCPNRQCGWAHTWQLLHTHRDTNLHVLIFPVLPLLGFSDSKISSFCGQNGQNCNNGYFGPLWPMLALKWPRVSQPREGLNSYLADVAHGSGFPCFSRFFKKLLCFTGKDPDFLKKNPDFLRKSGFFQQVFFCDFWVE